MAEGDAYRVEIELGTWAAALALLIQKGLPLGAFIDIGAADGYFGLAFWRGGLFRSLDVVNIDANPVYEPSLRKIRAAIGGDYRICAVDEREGSIELHTSAHPYWASAAPAGDAYWKTIDGQMGGAATVPCRRLDSILDEIAPRTPYALKLDIQGLEARALRSGPRALANTAVVVCEVIAANFHDIDSVLGAAGFALYDLTDVKRAPDHSLGWFYATYLHRDYDSLRAVSHLAEGGGAAAVEQQQLRRADILAKIDALVAKIGAERG